MSGWGYGSSSTRKIERTMMFGKKAQTTFLVACLCLATVANAGPYNEAGVNGYIGDDWQHADPCDSDANLNPIFRGWATGVSYEPTSQYIQPWWKDPTKALGPATGDKYDIVSLGDLDESMIANGESPGQITLSFSEPNNIRDVNGYDFVVFENGLVSGADWPNGAVEGQVFVELGYVEVSSDGTNFVRFPPVSLTPQPPGSYGILTVEISDIHNLAGKHPNGYGICTGTPFDLQEIAENPAVISGTVDINNINYVRIVDIPGSGDFNDQAVEQIDPNTWPSWSNYDANHPIYDAWVTSSSGGLDLEAIGVLENQEYLADINLDGIVDTHDLLVFASAWLSFFGQDNWIARCDLAEPKDLVINFLDFATFAAQWFKVEQWRGQ